MLTGKVLLQQENGRKVSVCSGFTKEEGGVEKKQVTREEDNQVF